jgi:hypothetical protein
MGEPSRSEVGVRLRVGKPSRVTEHHAADEGATATRHLGYPTARPLPQRTERTSHGVRPPKPPDLPRAQPADKSRLVGPASPLVCRRNRHGAQHLHRAAESGDCAILRPLDCDQSVVADGVMHARFGAGPESPRLLVSHDLDGPPARPSRW